MMLETCFDYCSKAVRMTMWVPPYFLENLNIFWGGFVLVVKSELTADSSRFCIHWLITWAIFTSFPFHIFEHLKFKPAHRSIRNDCHQNLIDYIYTLRSQILKRISNEKRGQISNVLHAVYPWTENACFRGRGGGSSSWVTWSNLNLRAVIGKKVRAVRLNDSFAQLFSFN